METPPPSNAVPFSYLFESSISGYGSVTDQILVPVGKQATVTSVYIGGQDTSAATSRVYVYKSEGGVDTKVFIGYLPGNEMQVFIEEVLIGSATAKFKVVRERLNGVAKIVFARVQGYMIDV